MKTSVLCVAALLTVLVAGCVNQPITPTAAAITAAVEPGDRIRLATRSGTEGDYRVVRIDREALYVQPIGRNHKDAKQSIAYKDIGELTVTRADRSAVISAGLVVATIVAGAAFYEAMETAAAGALCC